MLFHIYLFVLLAGIGIGSVEYIRWCERSLPTSADIPPEIALTFDDGPHPVYTKKLLDGLRKRGVKATFFLIGENIEGNEELVKQMAEDGHLIGNHTWSHVDVTKMSDKQACEEITKTSELVRSIVGYDMNNINALVNNVLDPLSAMTPNISVLLLGHGTKTWSAVLGCFRCSGPSIRWTGKQKMRIRS